MAEKPKQEENAQEFERVEVGGVSQIFHPQDPQETAGDVFLDSADEFTDLQIEDFTWKIKTRKLFGWILLTLLIVQNIVVFALVGYALFTGSIRDLQLIFGVLVAATLTETAYMIKVIVEWLFKDINYPV